MFVVRRPVPLSRQGRSPQAVPTRLNVRENRKVSAAGPFFSGRDRRDEQEKV
jgi:hypothetical protein